MLHERMHVFEREVNGHRYRIAAQSVWDPDRGRSVARQVVLGPAAPPPVADLRATRTVGTRAVGDVGALIWVAEQLDLVAHIDRACGRLGAKGGPSVGELALGVAIQRACSPGPKRDLGDFLDACVPRLSCLPGSAFSGQAFHRVAQQVTEHDLEQAQVAISKAAVARFELSTDVLPSWTSQEQEKRSTWGRARPFGQRDRACAALVSGVFRQRLGPGSAGGVSGWVEAAARGARRR